MKTRIVVRHLIIHKTLDNSPTRIKTKKNFATLPYHLPNLQRNPSIRNLTEKIHIDRSTPC